MLTNISNAQGKLGNLMAKAAAKVNGKSYSASDYADAAKDSANDFLDSKEILKDKKGLSGIYYSTTPVYATTQGGKERIVKKFLVNFKETEKKNYILTLNTQYAYETTNQAKWVKAADFSAEPGLVSKEHPADKVGYTYFDGANYDNLNYQYITHKSKKDLQGNDVPDGDYLAGWNDKDALEIEPGILLVGDISIYSKDTEKEINHYKKYKVVVVLYKKEKAAEAAKYTQDVIWDKLTVFWEKYDKASKTAYYNTVSLLEPKTGFKDEPSNDVLVKAIKSKMSKEAWKEELVYAYAGSEWINNYKLIGALQANTLVSRTIKVQCVFTKNGVCRVGMIEVKQENTFVTGSLAENFGTNPVLPQGNGPVTDMDCAKANAYKK